MTAVLAYDDDSVLTGSSDGLIRILSIQPNRMLGILGEHSGEHREVCPRFRACAGLTLLWLQTCELTDRLSIYLAVRHPSVGLLRAAKRSAVLLPCLPADYPIERLSMSADKAFLASASHDNTVKLWDLSQLAEDDDDDEEAAEEEEEGQEEAGTAAAAGDGTAPAPPAGGEAAAAAGPSGRQQQAAAAAAAKGSGSSDDSDDSDSEDEGRRPKGRKRGKGQHRIPSKKQAKGSNFFAGLL